MYVRNGTALHLFEHLYLGKGFSFQVPPLPFNISKYNLELVTHKCVLCTIHIIEKPQTVAKNQQILPRHIFAELSLFSICTMM